MRLKISTIFIYILSIFLLAWALPQVYSVIFEKQVAKTHMFFSPSLKKMVYTEQLLIDDMKAAEKSENHHADVVYKDETGKYYTRVEFEALIPFIYFRNMEMRGLLPMEIDGKSYTRADIESTRRVLELPSRHLETKRHKESIYPLVESNPNQVALVLPTDRFRITDSEMEFINSDENAVDPELTKLFTSALEEKGFAFPSKGIWGNFTIFKPYEAGIFAVDSKGQTFHILRKDNKPIIEKVPFDEAIVPAKIIISETADRKLYGVLLDTNNKIYLFNTKDYALTHIPSPNYNPESMDFKILLDPIYLTAIYSDKKNIHALAYNYNHATIDKDLEAVHEFSHTMSRTQVPVYIHLANVLFPFSITLQSEDTSLGVLSINLSDYSYSFSLLFAIALVLIYNFLARRKNCKPAPIQSVIIVIFGLYAFIPLVLMEQYRKRG